MSDEITISKSKILGVLDKINGLLCQSLYVLNVVAVPVIALGTVDALQDLGMDLAPALVAGLVGAIVWGGTVAALLSIRQHVKETERQCEQTNRLIVEFRAREQ